MKKVISFLLTLILLLSCQCCLVGCRQPVVDDIDDNYRVFYEIFVGSFSDSNGDGIGDLQGIINRMDYLNDGDVNSGKSLGIQGIWLSPIFESPSYHKYDVADYYAIDPDFGTQEDLVELITLCHERNIKLIIDLPINHTSSSNDWFTSFRLAHVAGNTQSEYYDFYTNATLSERVSGRTYNLIAGCTDDYYECNFSSDMPELNFDNEAVRQETVDIAKYYLDLGIDGFRFDAVKYIYYSNTSKSVEFWKWYMEQLTEIKEDIYCVGECWSGDTETLEYIQAMNCFNFQIAQAEGYTAGAAGNVNIATFTNYVEYYLGKLEAKNEDAMLISFLSNHDMDRAAGYVTLATKRAYMAANLYILCAGSPFIYYGEEIGLKGTRGGASTDANRRLAMLWGDGDTVTDPVGATYDSSKQTNGTVRSQMKDQNSLYNYYCRLIALRNKYPAIARGDYQAITYDEKKFGGFSITYNESNLFLFHNTADIEIVIDLSQYTSSGSYTFNTLCDYIGQGEAKLEGTTLTIGAKTSVIIN